MTGAVGRLSAGELLLVGHAGFQRLQKRRCVFDYYSAVSLKIEQRPIPLRELPSA